MLGGRYLSVLCYTPHPVLLLSLGTQVPKAVRIAHIGREDSDLIGVESELQLNSCPRPVHVMLQTSPLEAVLLGPSRQRGRSKEVVVNTDLEAGLALLPGFNVRTSVASIFWSFWLAPLDVCSPRSCSLNRHSRHHPTYHCRPVLLALFCLHLLLLLVLLHPPCAAEPPSWYFLVLLVSWGKLCMSFLGIFHLLLRLFSTMSTMALVESASYSHRSAIHDSRDSILLGPGLNRGLPYSAQCCRKGKTHTPVDQFNLASELKGIDGLGTLGLDGIDTSGFALREHCTELDSTPSDPRVSEQTEPIPDPEIHRKSQDLYSSSLNSPSRSPFRKWMRSLHRRAAHRPSVLDPHHHFPWYPSDADYEYAAFNSQFPRRTSSSGSSFGFVEAVRSASVSLVSVTSVNRSRRSARRSRTFSRTDRSSRASAPVARMSEDSAVAEKATLRHDTAVTERALQRRRVLEEIITTEESYIGDVRFLINVRQCLFPLYLSANPFQGLHHHPGVSSQPSRWTAVLN